MSHFSRNETCLRCRVLSLLTTAAGIAGIEAGGGSLVREWVQLRVWHRRLVGYAQFRPGGTTRNPDDLSNISLGQSHAASRR